MDEYAHPKNKALHDDLLEQRAALREQYAEAKKQVNSPLDRYRSAPYSNHYGRACPNCGYCPHCGRGGGLFGRQYTFG